MTTRNSWPLKPAVLALVAGGIGAATDGTYLAVIHAQEATPPNGSVVPFVATYIALIAVIALLASVLTIGGRNRAAVSLLVTSAVASGAVGFLAIFSIGLPLLVVACLLAVAAAKVAASMSPPTGRVAPLVGAFTALGILIAGFTLTGVFWGR